MKKLVLFKLSYGYFQLCSLLSPEWTSCFLACSPFSFIHMYLRRSFLRTQLTTYNSWISVLVRKEKIFKGRLSTYSYLSKVCLSLRSWAKSVDILSKVPQLSSTLGAFMPNNSLKCKCKLGNPKNNIKIENIQVVISKKVRHSLSLLVEVI